MPDSALFEHVFFQLSRPRWNKERREEGAGLGESDWAALLPLAFRNGVAGFIYRNVKDQKVLPEYVRKDLQSAYQQTTFRNLDQVAETLKILKVLAVNRIKAIPLKGVVASEILFCDLGVYPSSDIDILVHPDDLDAAKQVMQVQAGYLSLPGQSEEELQAGHYHYILHKKQYLLEIHWNLTRRYFDVPAEFWWQGVRTLQWRDLDILELAPEKYLMYAVFRFFDHCFHPLRFLVLIVAIVEHYASEICWDSLLEDCSRFKMRRLVIFTLQLAHEVLAADIPAELAKRKTPGYSALKKLCLSGILHGIERQHLRMMCYTALLDTPSAVAAALLGRLAPNRGELCLRYNLPPDSSQILLYYVMNPFLLFFKKNDER